MELENGAVHLKWSRFRRCQRTGSVGCIRWALQSTLFSTSTNGKEQSRDIVHGVKKMVPIAVPKHNKKGRCRCCGHKIQFKSIGKAYTVQTEDETAYLIQRCQEGFVVREFRARVVYPKGCHMKPLRYSLVLFGKLNGAFSVTLNEAISA